MIRTFFRAVFLTTVIEVDNRVRGGDEDWQGPFEAEAKDAEKQIDNLENGNGAYGGVKVGGEEVPE